MVSELENSGFSKLILVLTAQFLRGFNMIMFIMTFLEIDAVGQFKNGV